mgnify:FL=1
MAEDKKLKKQLKEYGTSNNALPLQGMVALLETTKGEYEYLQKVRDGLHTRVGILIALLSALVSAAFIKEMPGFVELFKNNIILAHFRLICLVALFVSFVIALISYVRIFFTRDYYVFTYHRFTNIPIEDLSKLSNEDLVMLMYREYANCIDHNQKVFDKTISHYKFGNKWLIATIAFTILSIIISII